MKNFFIIFKNLSGSINLEMLIFPLLKKKIIFFNFLSTFLYQSAYNQFFSKIKSFSDYSNRFKASKNETGKILKVG